MQSALRNIRRQLIMKRNSKSYILYALGEVFLVMVGILLALQVSNWNEQRKRSKQLNVILKTIKEDMVRDTAVAERVIQFYDTINKYSAKVINDEYNTENIESCLMCRNLLTLYQPYAIQQKGYNMLLNYSNDEAEETDSLLVVIRQFYIATTDLIEDSNDFVKTETIKNLDFFKTKPWFIDFLQGRFTDDMRVYFGESYDFKNRVATNNILGAGNHSKFIKAHNQGAKELITEIDERLEKP
ncbi:MAG: DUF6090 family protein [Bacteroidota bacterium]